MEPVITLDIYTENQGLAIIPSISNKIKMTVSDEMNSVVDINL